MLAIIGGSGLTKLPELEITERKSYVLHTAQNQAAHFVRQIGALGYCFFFFSCSTGFSQPTIAPHEITFCANIWALHSLGRQKHHCHFLQSSVSIPI